MTIYSEMYCLAFIPLVESHSNESVRASNCSHAMKQQLRCLTSFVAPCQLLIYLLGFSVSVSLNKLSKDVRDSVRRVFLNSTTQDRTPSGALRMAGLILDRVVGTLRAALLMSLIRCIVF